MPSPLGPYRSPPEAAERELSVRAKRWVGVGVAAVGALAVGLWLAPGVTAAVAGALVLYVGAPWFITRAPGG
ncbi:MAG: hypothetical protein H6719_24350 [Sandaracinaceae bacterium]|nr:hypothetical protein [Sandaracinaceae bacterium]